MGRGDVVPIVHRRSTYIFSPNLLGITALSNLFDSGERHSRVQPLLGGIEIVIPARSGFATAFLGVWLCGWAFGETFAVKEVVNGTASAFLYFWLAGWTLGGAFALTSFLWGLLGREHILVTRDQVALIHRCGPWRRVQLFEPREIRELRVTNTPDRIGRRGSMSVMPLWGDGTGPLLFDYGFRTVHVADGVSPAEARIIASEIREHARLLAP